MRAYEKSTERTTSECPSCGCGVGSYEDIDDIVVEVEYVTVGEWDDAFDGYLSWTENNGYRIHYNYHDCGCSCGWSDRDYLIECLEENEETYTESTVYVCGKCDTHFRRLSEAKECCTAEANLSPEQLMEKMIHNS